MQDDPLPPVHVLVAVAVLVPKLVVLGLGLALPELDKGVALVLEVSSRSAEVVIAVACDLELYVTFQCTVGTILFLGESLGLVVMGDGSRLRGRGFESQCRILDGQFSH